MFSKEVIVTHYIAKVNIKTLALLNFRFTKNIFPVDHLTTSTFYFLL